MIKLLMVLVFIGGCVATAGGVDLTPDRDCSGNAAKHIPKCGQTK